MAGEIFIADKLTLDNVKEDTQNILNKVNNIDVGGDINFEVKRFNSGGKAGVFTTFLDVVGEGELFACVLEFIGLGSIPSSGLKIEIDGKVLFEFINQDGSSSGSGNFVSGLVYHDLVVNYNSWFYIKLLSLPHEYVLSRVGLPFSDLNLSTSNRIVCLSLKPIKFKERLKISVRGSLGSSKALNYAYSVKGV